MTSDGWRIDDLAQRAALSVDTIRYYQREGLLPPAERVGRSKRYGPDHLARLERIRELQSRRFSLAAIRALLAADRPGVEGVFAGEADGTTLDLAELTERSGVDAETLDGVRSAGLVRDPAEYGRDGYDADDLDVLRAVAELRRAGLPVAVITELTRIYVTGVEAMQREVLELFQGRRGPAWTPEELASFQARAAAVAGDLLPRVRRVVEYVHARTLQRLTLGAIERS